MNDAKLTPALALLDSAIELCSARPDNKVLQAGLAKTFETFWRVLS
jgi:hypothetical protein